MNALGPVTAVVLDQHLLEARATVPVGNADGPD